MRALSLQGYAIVKMKIGALPMADDIERVSAVLEGLDETTSLIIDGVYSYGVEDALAIYQALPANRIEAFQSPLKANDVVGMQSLCGAGVPVMATEAEYRTELQEQLINQGAVKFMQTAPVACGGITRLNEINTLITSNDSASKTRLSLEVSSTAVAFAAACHFAAANKCVAHTEYHTVHQVFNDEFTLQALQGQPGWFQMPQRPGLGISLPLDCVTLAY